MAAKARPLWPAAGLDEMAQHREGVASVDLGLQGARALVAGGSGGLGGAVADALAGEGARVALVARASNRLTQRAAALDALAIPADLSSADGPAGAVAATVDGLGGLDLVLVNSGGPPPGRFEDLTDADWQRAIDGTLWMAIRLIRAALPHLRQSERPAILVNLSSSAREPIPGLTTSNLTRPGLAGLIKSLVPEIAPIRINGLAPGRLATDRIAQIDNARAEQTGLPIEEVRRQTMERIPLARYGDPAELGRVAAFLLSPAASYVNGAIVPIDGGMIRALP
jgi:3-oxoacyl-[acyl-carrier protein] reductase